MERYSIHRATWPGNPGELRTDLANLGFRDLRWAYCPGNILDLCVSLFSLIRSDVVNFVPFLGVPLTTLRWKV